MFIELGFIHFPQFNIYCLSKLLHEMHKFGESKLSEFIVSLNLFIMG